MALAFSVEVRDRNGIIQPGRTIAFVAEADDDAALLDLYQDREQEQPIPNPATTNTNGAITGYVDTTGDFMYARWTNACGDAFYRRITLVNRSGEAIANKMAIDSLVARVTANEQAIAEGRAGRDGRDGQDGAPGRDGQDGQDGAPGRDGRDGQDGAPGRDGADGAQGFQGAYRVWLYRVVDHGADAPATPTATYDGTNFNITGDTSWQADFPSAFTNAATHDIYESFAVYNPATGSGAQALSWSVPFKIDAEQGVPWSQPA